MEANLQTLTPLLGTYCERLSESTPRGVRAATALQAPRREAEMVLNDRWTKSAPQQWSSIVFRASIGDAGLGFRLCAPNHPPLVVSCQQLEELVRKATPWLSLLKREFADEGRL